MAHTTLTDYQDYAGSSYDATQDARIERMIPLAERELARRVGVDFYVVDTDAGEDWVYATCVIVDWMLTYDDPEIRADLAGPYKSQRLGDWAVTMRDGMWSPFSDLRIRSIIALYRPAVGSLITRFITAVGPRSLAAETSESTE